MYLSAELALELPVEQLGIGVGPAEEAVGALGFGEGTLLALVVVVILVVLHNYLNNQPACLFRICFL